MYYLLSTYILVNNLGKYEYMYIIKILQISASVKI